jgi:predicted O-linked N-acetylglucosamine transferase (SPINDLY family)
VSEAPPDPAADPTAELRRLGGLSRADRSGEARFALAERLAEMGLERAAARQLQRSLARIEAQGGAEAAEDRLRGWLERWPADRFTRLNLVGRLVERQEFAAGQRCLEEGLERQPDCGPLWQGLAGMFSRVGRYGEAIQAYMRAAELEPANGSCRTSLGHLFRNVGFVTEAIQWHGEALALQPDSVVLRLNHLFVLPLVAASAQQIAWCRQRCEEGLNELEEHLATLPEARREAALEAKTAIVCHPYYLIYHDHDDRGLLERYGRLISSAITQRYPLPPSPSRRSLPALGSPAPQALGPSGETRRIRLAMVSGFFHQHSNARAFEGLIRHLDRQRFELVLVHLATTPRDAVSSQLEGCCERTLILPPSREAACAALRELDLDLLFYTDIGMHPFITMLASERLAPVQATGWGVPHTSGMPQIDYYVSGDLAEPPEAQEHYSETLVRLPGLPCCYLSESLDPLERSRDFYLLPPDRPLWGCLHRLEKLHPDFDLALEAIARAVPEGLFVFVEEEIPALTGFYLDRLARTAPQARERVLMLARMDRREFIALGGCLDVLLDPFHFGSGITLYDTLHSGTPVVTLEGRFLRSRYVAAAYRLIGVEDPPVARSPQEYVERAVALMADPRRRGDLRQEIAAKAKAHLYDRLDYVRGFEDFAQAAVAEAGVG